MNWNAVLKLLVKGAIWAAGHPDAVKRAVDAIASAKKGKAQR